MRVAAAIEKKLTAAFKPVRLSITDESHKHQGHAGARPEGESHFRVEIVSQDFAGFFACRETTHGVRGIGRGNVERGSCDCNKILDAGRRRR